MKDSILSSIYQLFKEPYSSLVAALILGQNIVHLDQIRQNFIQSGLIHIMVLSGTNIAIFSQIIYKMFAGVNIKTRNMILITGIFVYNFIIGFQPSLMRASIVGCINAFGIISGKKTYTAYSLIFSLVLMLFINPDLVHSLSFVLSFAASFGIVLFQADISEYLKRTITKRFATELSTSISAQIGVTAILVYYFGSISFWGFLANILVSAVVVWITFVSILIVILHSLFGLEVPILILLVQYGFDYILYISNFFAHLPFSVIEFGI